jgi:hypothetical protein
VRVSFSVDHPRVGKKRERALVKLRVWKSKKKNRVYVTHRSRKRIPRDRVRRYKFLVRGKAARALRRAGVGSLASASARRARRPKSPESYLTVVVHHGRDIDADPKLDHIRLATASGKALRQSDTNLGGTSGTLTLSNDSGETVVSSAGAGICMYDDGNSGSNPSELNAVPLAPGRRITADIQADANTHHLVGNSRGVFQTSEQSAQLFNADARQFGFEVNVQYSESNGVAPSGLKARLPRFQGPISTLPNRASECSTEALKSNSSFVTGADTEDGLHTADLWSYGPDGARSDASINDFGLQQQLVQGGSKPIISIRKGPSPYQPNPDCIGAGAVWMSCVYPPNTTRALTQWTDVAIPGSHDSGTPQLNATEASLFRNGCNQTSAFERLSPTAVYNLAAAQRLNLRGQLDYGIRYLDIRAGYDTNTNKWRINHTLFTQSTLNQDLATIAQWAGAHQKREPIILDVTVCDAGTESHLDDLEKAFSSSLPLNPSLDSPPFDTFSLNELTIDPPDGVPPASFARLSMQDIYDFPAPSGNVLVLLRAPGGTPQGNYDPSFLQRTPAFVEQGGVASPGSSHTTSPPYSDTTRVPLNTYWPNEQTPFVCAGPSSANETIKKFPYTQTPSLGDYRTLQPQTQTPFMVGQILYTIHSDTPSILNWIANATHGNCPASLLAWEDAGLLQVPSGGVFPSASDIIASWGDDANIAILDDVANVRPDYVSQLVSMNQQRLANQSLTPP